MLNKRSLLRTTLAVAAAATLGFAAQAQDKTIKIGVTAGPHAQIMEVVKKVAAKNGLNLKVIPEVRDMVEVLIEDLGYDELAKPVKKPLDGMKFAGYVGCQTNRPFGIAGESFENPMYLDKLVESVGATATQFDQKVTCCGGALAFSEPDKAQAQIKDIIEAAYDSGAEMLVTPCPLCQANTEVYQGQINKKYGTKFNMPVLYYSQLMTLAYGGTAKEAALDGNVIKARKLEEFAAK